MDHTKIIQNESARNQKMYPSEIEFVDKFFTHNNWIYQPCIFYMWENEEKIKYRPDFYDGERDVFIEVVGTISAYQRNIWKYELFKSTYPEIKFEVRNRDGGVRPHGYFGNYSEINIERYGGKPL